MADAFLRGYRKANGPENIAIAKSPKYIAPFRPLTAPQMLKAVRESIEDRTPDPVGQDSTLRLGSLRGALKVVYPQLPQESLSLCSAMK